MKKSLISILSLCVIIACGGINTDEDEPSVDNNECRKMPEMSCTHSPDDLTLNVHFTVKEDDSVTVIANFAHSSIDDIVASGSDKLELHVDHMIYKPTIGWTYGRHDFGVLPYNPRIYEIYWWRNDTVVAQGIIDRLPRLISPFEWEYIVVEVSRNTPQ